jgi:hypothetical protein
MGTCASEISARVAEMLVHSIEALARVVGVLEHVFEVAAREGVIFTLEAVVPAHAGRPGTRLAVIGASDAVSIA